ncbi:MAG: DNA primase [Actinomycetota bacterium]
MPGRINPDDISDLRERTDLSEVIAAHTQLKKAGRVFKGLCCFHQEKTPSLTVDPGKQLYYCHGCGAGGDVFSFLQKAEGLTFAESAQRLADRLGMALRTEGSSGKPEGARAPLMAATEAAAAHFAHLLAGAPEAKGARKYLEGRGFSSEDAGVWRLGYSPAGADQLYRYLLGAKFTSKQILEAGLAYATDSGEHRDRFRGRVMFPVSDLSGKVVGFGARALGEEQPKYLNSPETTIYRKSKILFGLDRAKAGMVRTGTAIVTEGYTDVIAMTKIGFDNVVATCGTALGEEHFALIKRFCERAILAFDADAAGAVASERGFGLHTKIGLEVLVAPIPAGKDPADVALMEGREAAGLILDESIALMRFILEREISRHRLDTAEGKSKAVKAAAGLLGWEPSRVARSEHGFWVAKRIGVDPQQVQLEIAAAQDSGQRVGIAQAVRTPGHVKVEREALAILLESPSQRSEAVQRLNADHFTQPAHRVLFNSMREMEAAPVSSQSDDNQLSGENSGEVRGGFPPRVMERLPDDETRRLAAELSLTPNVTKDPDEVFQRLESFLVERRVRAAQAKLARLDADTNSDEYDSLFGELMRLEAERRSFDEH